MVRTQIYLSETQRSLLANLAACKGENVSEIIREAIEQYIALQNSERRNRKESCEQVFKKAFGMWKESTLDFTEIRTSADRL